MSLFHAHFIPIDLLILFQQADFHSQRENAPYVTLDAAESHLKNEIGLNMRKPVLGGLPTTQGQTSLRIQAFVIRYLESVICKLATSEI